jgi:hypothetical protein
MSTAQREHLKQLIDQLPESATDEAERLLQLMTLTRDEQEWQKLVSAAFSAWYEDDEYEYPEDAGVPDR